MSRSVTEIAEEMSDLVLEHDNEEATGKANELLCEALKSISDANIERYPIRDLLARYYMVGSR